MMNDSNNNKYSRSSSSSMMMMMIHHQLNIHKKESSTNSTKTTIFYYFSFTHIQYFLLLLFLLTVTTANGDHLGLDNENIIQVSAVSAATSNSISNSEATVATEAAAADVIGGGGGAGGSLESSFSSYTSSVWESYQSFWISMISTVVMIILISFCFWRSQTKYQRSLNDDNDDHDLALAVTEGEATITEDENARLTGRTSLSHPNEKVVVPPIKSSSSVSAAYDAADRHSETSLIDDESSEVVVLSKETQRAISERTFGKQTTQKAPLPLTMFFAFICLAQFIRSFEGGFTASLMSEISSDLDLNYKQEGTIAASPDYGLSPGAIISIWTFRHIPAKIVLSITFFGLGLSSIVASLWPTFEVLVSARAINGLLYAHAAVFYPIWIDRHGPTKHTRTVWFAWMNSLLLLGLIFGYGIGGYLRSPTTTSDMTWVELYFVNGCLMVGVGLLLVFGFSSQVIRNDGPYRPISLTHADSQAGGRYGTVEDNNNNSNDDTTTTTTTKNKRVSTNNRTTSVWELLCSLLHSFPYVASVLIVGCLVGGVTFAFYFISQVSEEMGYDTSTTTTFVLVVFLAAPIPGTLFGSYIVGHYGGYTNHLASFGMALVGSIFVLVASILIPFTEELPNNQGGTPLLLFANWLWFFSGSMPCTPLYGVGVSVLPRASLVASAVQFGIVNLSKVFVPQLGGIVCDNLGLVKGYTSTLMATALVLLVLSWISVLYFIRQKRIRTSSRLSSNLNSTKSIKSTININQDDDDDDTHKVFESPLSSPSTRSKQQIKGFGAFHEAFKPP